jgi:hypothetical protein
MLLAIDRAIPSLKSAAAEILRRVMPSELLVSRFERDP